MAGYGSGARHLTIGEHRRLLLQRRSVKAVAVGVAVATRHALEYVLPGEVEERYALQALVQLALRLLQGLLVVLLRLDDVDGVLGALAHRRLDVQAVAQLLESQLDGHAELELVGEKSGAVVERPMLAVHGRRHALVELVVHLVQLHLDVLDLELGVLEHRLGVLVQLFVALEALAERLEHVLGARLDLRLDLELTIEHPHALLVRQHARIVRRRRTRRHCGHVRVAAAGARRVGDRVGRVVGQVAVAGTWMMMMIAVVSVVSVAVAIVAVVVVGMHVLRALATRSTAAGAVCGGERVAFGRDAALVVMLLLVLVLVLLKMVVAAGRCGRGERVEHDIGLGLRDDNVAVEVEQLLVELVYLGIGLLDHGVQIAE